MSKITYLRDVAIITNRHLMENFMITAVFCLEHYGHIQICPKYISGDLIN